MLKVSRPTLVEVLEMLKRLVNSLTNSIPCLKSFLPTLTEESTTKTKSTFVLSGGEKEGQMDTRSINSRAGGQEYLDRV